MQPLPSYKKLKEELPLADSQVVFIEQSRQTIRNILSGIDSRLLLIVGPCSIHDPISAKEFAYRLIKLAEQVSNDFFIVMRTYFEKPRTTSGWKGFLYDPYLDGSNDLKAGIELTRELLLELTALGIPAATEFLDPLTAFYYDDLISWGSIGARTSSSQPHRQLASGVCMPIGIKNDISGNVSTAIHGLICASLPHTHLGMSEVGYPTTIQTKGNTDTHLVLRGGEEGPNYHSLFVQEALLQLKQHELPQRILIDCSHQNSGKRHDQQSRVFESIVEQIIAGNESIRGIMLESHLYAGNQSLLKNPSQLEYGISITDGCLDWHTTEALVLKQANRLVYNREENQMNRLSCAIAIH